jgi:hypothetical protein
MAVPPQDPPTFSAADIEMAKRVARNVNQRLRAAGISGLRTSVQACYAQARKTLKESSVAYCYVLDLVADTVYARTPAQWDDFWTDESAHDRVMAVLRFVRPDPSAAARSVQAWGALRPLAMEQLATLYP